MSKEYALILGVSSGIGAACAKQLAKSGINIIGLYMRKPKDQIEQLSNEILSYNVDSKLIKMNACNYEEMESLLSKPKKECLLSTDEEWEMEVKFLSSYLKTWYVPPMVVVERLIQVSDQPPLYTLAETTKSNLFCLEKMAPKSSSSKNHKK